MIIGINGYAGSGKDTVGNVIQYLTSKYKPCAVEDCLKAGTDFSPYTDWEIKKWAGKLKLIASILTGIPADKFEDQEFKKTHMGAQWATTGYDEDKQTHWFKPMTVREFLQRIGTDGLRDGLHANTWINALMADYEGIYDIDTDCTTWPNWVVTDTRFPNEAQAIKDAGGIVIRIDRPGVKPINPHPSETALDDWNFDYKVANVSDIFALSHTIKQILEKENII